MSATTDDRVPDPPLPPPRVLFAVEYKHPKRNEGKPRVTVCEGGAEAKEKAEDLEDLGWSVAYWRM